MIIFHPETSGCDRCGQFIQYLFLMRKQVTPLRPHGLQSPGPDFFEPYGLPNSTRRLFFQFSSPSGLLLLGLVSLGSTVGTSPRCCTPILISFDCCSDGNRYSNSSSRHRYSHSRTTHHHSHSRYCTHEKPHGLKETPPF